MFGASDANTVLKVKRSTERAMESMLYEHNNVMLQLWQQFLQGAIRPHFEVEAKGYFTR